MTQDVTRSRAASSWAARILQAAQSNRSERSRNSRLARLLADDEGRDLLLDLTDQVMRIPGASRSAHRLHQLTSAGVPRSLGAFDGFGLRMLGLIAPLMPKTTQRLVSWRVDKDTAGVILPANDPEFSQYLARRRAEGFRLNINILGEAILGDEEADERCARVEAVIRRPDVDYVSVKISAICANLDVLAWEHSLARIDHQLTRLYRAAMDQTPYAFVNLDMEEYRDLELSVESFIRVLGREEFHSLPAGIVLQAYIPDSHAALERLCQWANARHASGGAPIKIRIVKGANLANELVEAELYDWPLATYDNKPDVDASYKRMLERALELGHPDAVRLGVASHNLFEVGWAVTLRNELPDPSRLEIEMLEGMAPPQARAVRDAVGSLLLYSPVVAAADREASIAYLSRRLDENAASENFLRALFDIYPGSPAWIEQEQVFLDAVEHRLDVPTISRRVQNRALPVAPVSADGSFHNAADTDFTQLANRRWITEALTTTDVPSIELVTTKHDVDAIVDRALSAQHEWAETGWQTRRAVLARVAEVMEAERGRTIAILAKTTGKTVREADPEVSEAIDFATYAAHLTLEHERLSNDGAAWQPHPVVLVAGPWNFPYAIPACGLVHAIAAGSAVILKPAPQARAVGAQLVRNLHAAGVPEGLVQLACTPDDEVGQHLVTHTSVDFVMLTGSYETAELFTSWKPDIRLLAETSGKNAIVVTQAADIDQAIKDIVKSAFGYAGQKCSAASLAIVEAPIYDDPVFLARLADAVRSVRVGSSEDLPTMMGPLIEAPGEKLLRGLTVLEPGESWLVKPECLDASRNLWSPGVRVGVQRGSWFHQHECFGPVLGVMRARDLDEAIALQNDVEFGLTGGIESLDPNEIEIWLSRVEVGNAYVNRPITGAIVQRQPFGGWKKSSIGAGGKPGGPAHLHSYGTWTTPVVDGNVGDAFAREWARTFAVAHDASGLVSESNLLRFRPLDRVILRVGNENDPQVAIARVAALTSGVELQVSSRLTESDAELAARLGAGASHATRLRLITDAEDEVLRSALLSGIVVDRAPVSGDPRIELHHWVLEQSVSRTMHRHGRLIGVKQ